MLPLLFLANQQVPPDHNNLYEVVKKALHVVTVDQTHQLALAHLVCLRNGSLALRGPLLPPSLLNNAPRQGG